MALPGGVPLELAWIPAGRFEVQGVGRTHAIGVTRGFWMATAETTRAQWAAVMGTDSPAPEEADMPVSRVSWSDATNFVARANAAVSGLALGLPTEAEWELAARGGHSSAAPDATTNAWHAGNSGKRLHPGRQLAPNAFGLFDMGGNVAEWCRDWNAPDRFGDGGLHRNPAGPETGSERVCRGGSYLSPPANVGPSARTSAFPDARMPHIGFRVIHP
jgi:formylglycine-generating enzyme required for sulfatase activity